MRFTSTVVALATLASSALAQNDFLSSAVQSWEDTSVTTTYQATSTVTMTLEVVHTETSYGWAPSSSPSSSPVAAQTSSTKPPPSSSIQKPTSSSVTSQPSAPSTPSPAALPATGGSASNGVNMMLAVAAAGAVALMSS